MGTIIDYKAGSPTKFTYPQKRFYGKKVLRSITIYSSKKISRSNLSSERKRDKCNLWNIHLQLMKVSDFFEARCLPLLHDKIMIIVSDITERKKTEELLNKSDTLAAIGQLAAGVAHELGIPLTVINGFIQLFQN